LKLVVDANVVISAIIRDSVARKLLFGNSNFELYSPGFLFEELEEHREEIMRKAGLDFPEFQQFTEILRNVITVAPAPAYSEYLDEARKVVSDEDDLPYAALAIALTVPQPSLPDTEWAKTILAGKLDHGSTRVHDIGACGVWTNDPHFTTRGPEFLQRFGIKIWTTHGLHSLMST